MSMLKVSHQYIMLTNFKDYTSIVTSPVALETIYDEGIMFLSVGNGTTTLTLTSPSGCSHSYDFIFAVPQLITLDQPKCPNSVVDVTMSTPFLFKNYAISGRPDVLTDYPFKLRTGMSQVTFTTLAGGRCIFYSNLSPLSTAMPSLTITHAKCDGTNGTIKVDKYSSYTSLQIYVIQTNETLSAVNGLFANLPVSAYTITLVSATCGTEVISGAIDLIEPVIDVQLITDAQGCLTKDVATINATIAGLPNAKFSISDSDYMSSPFNLPINGNHQKQITYQDASNIKCNDKRYLALPFPTADVYHSLSSVPTCKSPNTTVTLTSSRLNKITVEDIELVNGQFTGIYGSSYLAIDGCSQGNYHFSIPRTQPIYTVDVTSGTCAGLWTITITNMHEYKQVSIFDPLNESISYTSPNGVFTNLTPRQWVISAMEKDCDGSVFINAPVLVEVTPSGWYEEIDRNSIVFTTSIIRPNYCNITGLINITATYDGIIVAQGQAELNQNNLIMLTPINSECDSVPYVPVGLNLPSVPKITLISPPSCDYSNDGVVEIVLDGPNTFLTLTIDDTYYVKSQDNLYPISAGTPHIQLDLQGCSNMKYEINYPVKSSSDFKIKYSTTPQRVNDCTTPSGSLTILNTETFTKLEVGYNSLESGKTWTQLGANEPILIDFATATCTGKTYVTLPTEDITITTTQLQYTCKADGNYLLKATNGSYDYTQSLVDFVVTPRDNDANYRPESSTIYNTNNWPGDGDLDIDMTFHSCHWVHRLSPKEEHRPEDLFSFKIIQYPSCYNTADGIIQIINNFDLPLSITRVISDFDFILKDDKLYGLMLNQWTIDTPLDVALNIQWNEGCQQNYQFKLDLSNAPKYIPEYTLVPPNCGSTYGKVVVDKATLQTYDLNIDGKVLPNEQGEIHFLVTPNGFMLNVHNRVTKCLIDLQLGLWYDVPVENFASAVVQPESCPGTGDGKVTVIAPTGRSRYQLTASTSDSFNGPNDLVYLPVQGGNTFTGLTSRQYILTRTNPTNPFCFERQSLEMGAFQPTITTVTPDQCSVDQSVTVSAEVTGSFSNITYTLDNGQSQTNNGQFAGLLPGQHTLQVEINDAKCRRIIPSTTFTIDSNPMTVNVDTSVCDSLTITASSVNSTKLTVTVGDVTKDLVSGTSTFQNLKGSLTATVTDESGCSISKSVDITTCELSSSTITKSSLLSIALGLTLAVSVL
eukprot:gene3521-4027_t